MTPTPMVSGYLKRYRKLKWALIICSAVAVFSMSASAILAAVYFSGKRNVRLDLQRTIAHVSAVDALQTTLEKPPKWNAKAPMAEMAEVLSRANEIREASYNAGLIDKDSSVESLFNAATVADLRIKAAESKQRALAESSRLLKSHDDRNRELIAIGAMTLVFGILFPMALLALISKLMTRLLIELQNSAVRIAREWSHANSGRGGEAFKNFDFWFKTVLILNSEMSRYSSHPVIQLTGELSALVKRELEKDSPTDSAA